MFIQVIRGQVSDAAAARAAIERWDRELRPGATGFLGRTGGITPDGTLVGVVRFESAEAARRNSERPEQGAWWGELSQLLTDVRFYDCPTVDVGLAGGSDKAGFVQLMISRVSDVAAARRLGAEFAAIAPQARPDLIGYTDAYTDDGIGITTSYFTSESDARLAEKNELPAEHQELFGEFSKVVTDTEYLDLPEPWFTT